MRVLVIEQRDVPWPAFIRPVRERRVDENGERESVTEYYLDAFWRFVTPDSRLHADECPCKACICPDAGKEDCGHEHGEMDARQHLVMEMSDLPPRETRNRWRIQDGVLVVAEVSNV